MGGEGVPSGAEKVAKRFQPFESSPGFIKISRELLARFLGRGLDPIRHLVSAVVRHPIAGRVDAREEDVPAIPLDLPVIEGVVAFVSVSPLESPRFLAPL